jgi:hypothetical protein
MKSLKDLLQELDTALERKLVRAMTFHPAKDSTLVCLWLLHDISDAKIAKLEATLKTTYKATRVEKIVRADRALIMFFDETLPYEYHTSIK